MIIDSHVHLDTSSREALYTSYDALERKMDASGVDIALAMPLAGPTYNTLADCDRLIALSQRKSRILPIAAFDLDEIKSSRDTIIHYLKEDLVVGVKFFTGYQPIEPLSEHIAEILNLVEQKQIPVLFHTGPLAAGQHGRIRFSSDYLVFDDLAYARPTLKINCAHFNNPNFMQLATVMEGKSTIHADLSGLFYGAYNYETNPYLYTLETNLYYAMSFLNTANRFMFGSDHPICDMDAHLQFMNKFMKMNEFTLEDQEKILSQNTIHFYNLEKRLSHVQKDR